MRNQTRERNNRGAYCYSLKSAERRAEWDVRQDVRVAIVCSLRKRSCLSNKNGAAIEPLRYSSQANLRSVPDVSASARCMSGRWRARAPYGSHSMRRCGITVAARTRRERWRGVQLHRSGPCDLSVYLVEI